MRTVPVPAAARGASVLRSKRVLALAGDDRLVEQIRRGSEAAFEVAFERHGPPILSFCRHMLRSPEEAEDAVQHTFAAAYRDLQRDEREIRLKPWLFTIARNRCLSIIRARREQPVDHQEIATEGLSAQVERRADLRDLLHDVRELPGEQRAALLLAEVADLSHSDVARVLGCELARVKALVFRARSGLIERREARATPCEEIREQLATLRGGALRRSGLRHHLSGCVGCREYHEQVKRQRAMLAVALPVAPSLGLKSSVLGALGFGGGAAGGGGAVLGGASVASTASVGATVAKLAVVAALVGGGAVAGEQALKPDDPVNAGPVPAAVAPVSAADRAEAPLAAKTGAGDALTRAHHQAASKRFQSRHSRQAKRRKVKREHRLRAARRRKAQQLEAKVRTRGQSHPKSTAPATPAPKAKANPPLDNLPKPQAAPKAQRAQPKLGILRERAPAPGRAAVPTD